jgi:signal transduction histidine kinase
MRERVDLVGGELEVQSSPGQGTVVSARLPVIRADEIVTERVEAERERSSL